ncbi:MAG TPA: ATP-binding protein [Phycisphaerae bacterium]|nr:ATP-binding protein [Phycisphaerae bacterium]
MTIHQSSINFRNLIRDLAEMYPYDVAEVIVVELVANSLDAGATRISVSFDREHKVLTIADNGSGMDEGQFEEYHDFAAGLKVRGAGIGFAGLGAKISFNVADRVVTETTSPRFVGGSNWYLATKRKLLWEEIPEVKLTGHGTRVSVHFRSQTKIPYGGADDLPTLLRRHYLPLFDRTFLELYDKLGLYSTDLRFRINGRLVAPQSVEDELHLATIKRFMPRRGRNRIGYGILGVAEQEYPVAGDLCGVLLCTRGKVIKADFFNQFPARLGPRIFGLVEMPDFVKFLTTAKTDFIRKGRHKQFEALYDPLRREFRSWLGELGIQSMEATSGDEAIKLERELKRLRNELPELAEFPGLRSPRDVLAAGGVEGIPATMVEGAEATYPLGDGQRGQGPARPDEGSAEGSALAVSNDGREQANPISRTSRGGPKIGFADDPAQARLAWVEGGKIIINSGHPAYRKVRSNDLARRVHNFFAIAEAIERVLPEDTVASDGDDRFVDRMMAAWGRK